MKPARHQLPALTLLVLCPLFVAAGEPTQTRFGIQHCVTEWSYSTGKTYSDPFNQVELDVLVTDPEGHEQRVPAFWAGDSTWRVRYAPHTTGKFTCRAVCS